MTFENAALSRAEFKCSDFKQVSLRRADLREVVAFEWKIRHSLLEGANFAGASPGFTHVYNSDLTSSTFDSVPMRQAHWITEGRWDFFISHASVDKERWPGRSRPH